MILVQNFEATHGPNFEPTLEAMSCLLERFKCVKNETAAEVTWVNMFKKNTYRALLFFHNVFGRTSSFDTALGTCKNYATKHTKDMKTI